MISYIAKLRYFYVTVEMIMALKYGVKSRDMMHYLFF